MCIDLLKRYYWLLLAIGVFFFAWNDQSLWIDECCMVMSATKESFADVWAKVTDIGGSDTQMACYLYLLHIWIKIFGVDTEMLYRLYNFIWVLLAAWFLRKEPKILLVLLISPFFIYYINELRPYVMQIAASCGISMFIYKRSLGERQSYVNGFGLLFLLCLTSLTSVILAIGFLLAWIVLEGKDFWSRNLVRAIVYWAVPFIGLGSYYLYTLLLGARATFIKSSGLVNLCASAYELFGLTGLGPARSELRLCTQVGDIVGNSSLLIAVFGGLFVVLLFVCGLYGWKQKIGNKLWHMLGCLLVIPVGIYLYSSAMMDFRFSGRHFAPLLPMICIVIAHGLSWSKKHKVSTCLTIFVLGFWLVSDLYIRYDDTYAREDFRGAITYCKQEQEKGNTVLLLCNGAGKEYYQWQDIVAPEDWITCQRIVVTRPDDYSKLIGQIESSNLFQKRKLCPAFWVYELSK